MMIGFQAEENLTGRAPKKCAKKSGRYLFACRAESCTAGNSYNALKKLIKMLPTGTIKSLTEDRGKKFAWYQKIENELRIPYYFADPHSPWRKDQTRIQMAF